MYNLGTFSHWIHPWNIAELIYINCVFMYNAWHKKLNKCQLITTHLMIRCMYVIELTKEGLQHGRICCVCQKLHHVQKEWPTVSTEGLLHQVSVWGRVRISLLFCLVYFSHVTAVEGVEHQFHRCMEFQKWVANLLSQITLIKQPYINPSIIIR